MNLASALDLHNESHPGHRIDDPVNRRPRVGLKRFHCGFGIRTKHAVNGDGVPARPQQILQRLYRVPISAD